MWVFGGTVAATSSGSTASRGVREVCEFGYPRSVQDEIEQNVSSCRLTAVWCFGGARNGTASELRKKVPSYSWLRLSLRVRQCRTLKDIFHKTRPYNYIGLRKNRPLRIIWHNFTNLQHLLIIFGRVDLIQFLMEYVKQVFNWRRTSFEVAITTVATWLSVSKKQSATVVCC